VLRKGILYIIFYAILVFLNLKRSLSVSHPQVVAASGLWHVQLLAQFLMLPLTAQPVIHVAVIAID
jgi:hypothetical protein